MIHDYSVLEVKIMLDSVPGWGHVPDDHVRMLQDYLNKIVPHYKPEVKFVKVVSDKGENV